MSNQATQAKRFQKKAEDFICGHCGARVQGDGFTNHCPKCLWSKHVDVYPGDRGALCRGMMEPVFLEKEKDEWNITHQCQLCGYRKRNRSSKHDNFEMLVGFAKKLAEGKG